MDSQWRTNSITFVLLSAAIKKLLLNNRFIMKAKIIRKKHQWRVQQCERSAGARFTGTYFYSESVKQGISIAGACRALALSNSPLVKSLVLTVLSTEKIVVHIPLIKKIVKSTNLTNVCLVAYTGQEKHVT